ncbi:MAG: hypothetical protein WC319_05150 [Candidatus Paceibacterota bacterium]|jgi:hypothetical protein
MDFFGEDSIIMRWSLEQQSDNVKQDSKNEQEKKHIGGTNDGN